SGRAPETAALELRLEEARRDAERNRDKAAAEERRRVETERRSMEVLEASDREKAALAAEVAQAQKKADEAERQRAKAEADLRAARAETARVKETRTLKLPPRIKANDLESEKLSEDLAVMKATLAERDSTIA